MPSSVGDANEARMNTADEVGAFVSRFMASILRSRSALVNPKKRTLEDLRNSRHAVISHSIYGLVIKTDLDSHGPASL